MAEKGVVWTKRNKNFYHYFTLIFTILIVGGSVGMMQNASGITVVPIAEYFGIERAAASTYLSDVSFILAIIYIFIGFIQNRVPSRVWIPLGLFIGAAGMIIAGQATEYQTVRYAAGLMAVVEAVNGGAFQGSITPNWWEKHVGFLVGLVAALCSGIGVIWNIIGGIIIANFGWKADMMAIGVYLAILGFISIFFLRYRPAEKGLLPYGAEDHGQEIHPVYKFVATKEDKDSQPGATMKQALLNPTYWLILALGGVAIGITAISTALPGYAMEHGMSMAASGSIGSIALVGRMVGSLFIGILFDKWGSMKATLALLLIGIVGAVLLLLAPNLVVINIGCFLIGNLYGLATVGPTVMMKEFIGLKDFPPLNSWLHIVVALGYSYWIPVYSAFYDKYGSYGRGVILVMGIMAACAVIAVLITLFGKNFVKKWQVKEDAEVS